jgi:hypothetical protein
MRSTYTNRERARTPTSRADAPPPAPAAADRLRRGDKSVPSAETFSLAQRESR